MVTVSSAATPTVKDGAYAWYVVGVLTLAYAVGFIDRQILNLLVEPIKLDMTLSDTQISLLQGFAFTVAYVMMGPFFGRWIDIGNRRNILFVGVALWSLFTVLCGLSRDYWQLFGARMGVGGAEACLLPAAWSILSDYFGKQKLPRAMSVLLMGPYLGGGLALIFGGLVLGAVAATGTTALPLFGALAPWQIAFVAVGVPGFAVALLMLSIREPARDGTAGAAPAAKADARTFTLREIAAFLWGKRAFYGAFYGGMSLHVIVLYALPAWAPAFLVRRFDTTPAAVGIEYGTLVLIVGSLGVLAGPYAGRLLERRFADAPFRTPALAALGVVPFALALPFCESYWTAMAVLAGATFFYSLPMAMAASALQIVTPNRMRGLISSLYVFTVSVIGLGLAPTVIAAITDFVFGDPSMVGWSLAVVCSSAGLVASILMFRGLQAFRTAVAELQA